MDHLISAWQPDLIINNNKKENVAAPADHRVKLKESEKKNKYLDPIRGLKKPWNMKVTVIPIVVNALDLVKELENLETSGDNPNCSIVEIGQNTEKSPGDLRKLAVTQTPIRNHRLTLMRKTLKGVK